MVPPSYDDVISEDEVLGSEEDLAKAAKLVPHARIYACIRASEDVMSLSKTWPILLLSIPVAPYCLPCICYAIKHTQLNLHNTLYIVTDKSVIVTVADHEFFLCPCFRSGKDYQEIPFQNINSIAVDNRGAGCRCVAPTVQLMMFDRPVPLYIDEPDKVCNLIRRLKGKQNQPQTIAIVQQPTTAQIGMEKRIFVGQTGTNSFTIVQLRGDSRDQWQSFQEEIRQTLGLPKSSSLRMALAEVNAEITSAQQLQSNDKIVVESY